jgi:hypothetical protein
MQGHAMTTPLARRLGRLEQVAAANQRRPIRDRVEQIMRRLGTRLPAAEVEEIVTRYVGVPARIRRLRDAGLSDDRIIGRLTCELAVGGAE